MKNILFFDEMLTPKIITIVYWLCLAAVVISGLTSMFTGKFLNGLLTIIFGAIAIRIWCELLIVLFKMNEALQEIRTK